MYFVFHTSFGLKLLLKVTLLCQLLISIYCMSRKTHALYPVSFLNCSVWTLKGHKFPKKESEFFYKIRTWQFGIWSRWKVKKDIHYEQLSLLMSFNIFLLFIACWYKMHLAEFIATTLIHTPLEVQSYCRDARYRCMFNARQSIYLAYIIFSIVWKFKNCIVVLHRSLKTGDNSEMLVTDSWVMNH